VAAPHPTAIVLSTPIARADCAQKPTAVLLFPVVLAPKAQ